MLDSLSSRRRTALLCLLAVSLLVAGCSGLTNDEPELPDGEEAAERFSSLDAYNATLVTETTFNNQTSEARIERTVRPSTGEQYQVSRGDGNQTITVSNGTTTWIYRPATNSVTITQFEQGQQSNRTEQIQTLIDSVEDDESSGTRAMPILPFFSASSSGDSTSTTETDFWSDPLRVSYEGVETVDGRETHVISMQSAEGAERQLNQTLYFDAEYFVVLKGEYEMTLEEDGTTVAGKIELKDVDFDPNVSDDIFEFEPPANATVERPTEDIDQYESYSELEQASEKPVPDPSVPAEFEFDTGTVTQNGTSLLYTDGSTTLILTRRQAGTIPEEAEQITRDGRTYYYSERFGTHTIRWECGDTLYSISGDLDKETLLDIGASVECHQSGAG